MVSLGLVANVYNEANALPGWLETHAHKFDDVRVLHAGPRGQYSDDGTIELLERWHVPIEFCSIDDGFGVVRTRAIHMSPCDYVMILDADERFHSNLRRMVCAGEATPQHEVDRILRGYDFSDGKTPDWLELDKLGAGLNVVEGDTYYDHIDYLRDILYTKSPDAVVTVRRHWHDFSFRRPTQDWMKDPDWQLRVIRRSDSVHYSSGIRMHERLEGVNDMVRANPTHGPFFDHYHFFFKKMEPDQRRHDVAIYNAIHEGKEPPTS